MEQALGDTYFFPLGTSWMRLCLRHTGASGSVPALLATSYADPKYDELRARVGASLVGGAAPQLLDCERALSPAKFTDLDIPTYIIPIRPPWAAQLFDTRLAEQDLFGLPPELGFRLENVYYRSPHGTLHAPARVLWYVSYGDRSYAGAGSLRATSYLDEVVVDTAKAVFARFKRLGVYHWKNILEVTKQSPDAAVMALRFSGTELFDRPIPWEHLQNMLREHTGRGDQLQGPVQITKELFFKLYSRATTDDTDAT